MEVCYDQIKLIVPHRFELPFDCKFGEDTKTAARNVVGWSLLVVWSWIGLSIEELVVAVWSETIVIVLEIWSWLTVPWSWGGIEFAVELRFGVAVIAIGVWSWLGETMIEWFWVSKLKEGSWGTVWSRFNDEI